MAWYLAIRKIRYFWQRQLAFGVYLTLLTGLLSTMTLYGDRMAAIVLHQVIAEHSVPERNILIVGRLGGRLDEEWYQTLKERLGDLIVERVDMRQIRLLACELPCLSDELDVSLPVHYAQLWAFDDLANRVQVVEGRLPGEGAAPSGAGSPGIPVSEVALGVNAVSRTNLGIGDIVTVLGPTGPAGLEVVGIIEPLAPDADYWWNDPTAFGFRTRLLGRSVDLITVSLFVLPPVMVEEFPDNVASWRVLIDTGAIDVDDTQWLSRTLINTQVQMANHQMELHSGLPDMLNSFRHNQGLMRIVMVLLMAQVAAVMLITIGIIINHWLDRRDDESTALAVRGAGRLRIMGAWALQSGVLAVIAALLGPLLAFYVIQAAGSSPLHVGIVPLRPRLWMPALITCGIEWIIGMILTARHLRTHRPASIHLIPSPVKPPVWQRWGIDFACLAAGGVAFWQLSRSGSFAITRSDTALVIDSFLLFSSSVLLAGILLLLSRLTTVLFGVAIRIAERGKSLLLPLGLARLRSRTPEWGPALLSIMAVAGLGIFSSAFYSSVQDSLVETAHFTAGAALRVEAVDPSDPGEIAHLSGFPGVTAVSPVQRAQVSVLQGRAASLLVIDPSSFARIARYPPGQDAPVMEALTGTLTDDTSPGLLPAIVSASLLTSSDAVGDQVLASAGSYDLDFEIRAIADTFPALEGMFIITTWDALNERLGDDRLPYSSSEWWLEVQPDRWDDQAIPYPVIADAQQEYTTLVSDEMLQGITTAHQLQGLILCVTGIAGALIIQRLSVHRGRRDFSDLCRLGMTPGQLTTLIALENSIVAALGVLFGVVVGYTFARLSLPVYGHAILPLLSNLPIYRVVVEWSVIIRAMVIFVACYAGALILFVLLPARSILRSWPIGSSGTPAALIEE